MMKARSSTQFTKTSRISSSRPRPRSVSTKKAKPMGNPSSRNTSWKGSGSSTMMPSAHSRQRVTNFIGVDRRRRSSATSCAVRSPMPVDVGLSAAASSASFPSPPFFSSSIGASTTLISPSLAALASRCPASTTLISPASAFFISLASITLISPFLPFSPFPASPSAKRTREGVRAWSPLLLAASESASDSSPDLRLWIFSSTSGATAAGWKSVDEKVPDTLESRPVPVADTADLEG
mmetsp:Transcript_23245/g.72653  ORF Transcript_23245/g.72653 Transcript_23245/m.72653 type:complete len:237 (-) Transcript_23245:2584-3294(-)